MVKKGLESCFYDFSAYHDVIAVDNMLNIPQYLMKNMR